MQRIVPEHRLAYRAFVVNQRGHVSGAPEIISAADDGDAVRQAQGLVSLDMIEVWEGARLVARIPGADGSQAPTGERHQ